MTHQEMRLLKTIFVCSIVLVSAFIYMFAFTPQKKSLFHAWILGPDGSILGPVLAIASNQSYSITLGVQNSMGYVEYCKLKVKFRNVQFDNRPSVDVSMPSLEVTNFQFFLLDNETWTKDVRFRVESTTEGSILRIRGIEIDNSYFTSNLTSSFDSNRNGFFWQFRFELWAFNTSSNDFYFTNTWVSSPLLNITT